MNRTVEENGNPLVKDGVLLFTGGSIYFYMEIIIRGFSHASMFLCGGICFLLVGRYGSRWYLRKKRTWKTYAGIMLAGSGFITSLEFVTGIVVNRILKLDVWDYSCMKYNVLGQICPAYSCLWAVLSIACVYVYMLIDEKIFRETEKK